uniref:Uncharacterized protein n=1 Tax=Lepeophtheirus salmonis TaxID=72036 RepID=A0A0K2TST3_LEPSM
MHDLLQFRYNYEKIILHFSQYKRMPNKDIVPRKFPCSLLASCLTSYLLAIKMAKRIIVAA